MIDGRHWDSFFGNSSEDDDFQVLGNANSSECDSGTSEMDCEETETLLKDMEDVPTSQVLEVITQLDFRLFY